MCELRIIQQALHHNIRLVRRLAGKAEVIGVIKGNGYGLGLLELAEQLTGYGVRYLAVSELEDGLLLKRNGISAEIMLLTPLYEPKELERALCAGLILCIDTAVGADAAETAALRLGITGKAQLCVDTGFGRYGFHCGDVPSVEKAVRAMTQIKIIGTYSHLSQACARDSRFTMEQYLRFVQFCSALEENGISVGLRHLADSYAMLRYPKLRMDGVRIGSAFLGRLPFSDRWGFEPIGTLSAKVQEVRTIPSGSRVGYGGTVVTKNATQIAVVDAGYSHGFGVAREKAKPRGIRALLRLLCGGRKKKIPQKHTSDFPILGPIGMCATVLDVTGSEVQVGDRIELAVNPLLVNPMVPRRYV